MVTRTWAVLLFLLGPVATLIGIAKLYPGTAFDGVTPLSWLLVSALLIFWSPLPITVPAILLGDARDATLPHYRGFRRIQRSVLLIPHMLVHSPARVELLCSLVGFVAGCWAVTFF